LHTSVAYAKREKLSSPTLDNLLMIHREIISGSSGADDIQKNGSKLITETFNFIQSPKNKKFLDTPSGRELLRHQTLLGNYMAVKSHFEKCIKDKNAKRDLHSRILDSSLQSMGNNDVTISPCKAFNSTSKDFVDLNNKVMKLLKNGVTAEANEALKNTIMINGARALLNFKHKFDPKFKASAQDIDNIAKLYNVKDKNELKNALNDYAAKIKSTPKNISQYSVQQSLNQSIKNLNANKTAEQLIQEVQTPAGALLLTPTMRDREKPIQAKDVANIIKESEEQILSEKDDTISERTTDGLVKINPFATGEMLLTHPEYAGIICDSINKINATDTSKEKRDHYVRVGTAVLGGALVLTGVGAMAGAYILTGSLTAGLAAGTIAGTLVAGTSVASVVAGLGSALYEGRNAYFSHREMIQLENAFLTNNGDAKNIEEAKIALGAYKESRTSAMIALASVGWNAVSFGKLFSMQQLTSKTFALSQMKATAKIFDTLAQSKVAIKLKGAMNLMGEVAMSKVDTFMFQLAKVGESARTKILALLKDSRFTPKDMKELMDEALIAAKNCT